MSDPAIPPVSRVKVVEKAGVGCLVQALGVALLFVFPIGTVIGFLLFGIGSKMSTKWLCGACRSKLPDDKGTICPSCRAPLTA